MRYFKVSSTGNGIGVAVIRTAAGKELILRVHPKPWRPPDASPPAVVRVMPTDDRTVVTVYELDTVEVPDHIADTLTAHQEITLGEAEGPANDRDEGTSPLLTEVTPPRSPGAPPRIPDQDGPETDLQDQAMWKLVGAMDQLTLQDSTDLPAVLASAIATRQPGLRQVFLEEFTKLAEKSIRYQQPEFRRNAGPLMAVRGRILVNDLVERKARRQQAISCEYTELTTDTLLWQTIRAALRQCLTELPDTTSRSRTARERALRADAHLSTVTATSPYGVLQEAPLTHEQLPSGVPQRAYRAARALLTQATGFGTTSGHNGAALSIKITTSHLWEEILRRRFQSAGYSVETAAPQLRIFQDTPMPKRPDIELRDPTGALVVIDAKYKTLRALEPGKMSMSDQYQMYAYATQREAPTLFIHVGDPGCTWTRTSAPTASGRWYPTGVASLPFPSPQEALALEEFQVASTTSQAISALHIGQQLTVGGHR
ncbi:5-methylcytosine restriction system specificity protein McrC [Kocuria kalidii]|uniref:5-methylcytosine restriction system specificity protein McrC n=1 Tax=Kocuria kalidii TaxID=3376283 RepID=UPI0037B3358C